VQGVFTRDGYRFKSKKALREALAESMENVVLEATSLNASNEFDGRVSDAPNGRYYIAGPDPHNKRHWYATIDVSGHVDAGTRKAVMV
jgi:hypothetical protein